MTVAAAGGNTLVKTPDTSGLMATWWAQKPGGNWYWRCTVPARRLPGQALAVRYDDLQPHADGIWMPRQQGEAAIWCYISNATRGIIAVAQQQAGWRVLVEVDDNYLIGPPEVPNKHSNWEVRIRPERGGAHSIEAHRKLAGILDGVIVSTEQLAHAYRQYSDHVYVCPNSVDPDDWPAPEKPQDGIFRIGYAASHSHWFDASDVYRALSWAAAQPQVEVLLYGLNPNWTFPYQHVPWTDDLDEYRRSLARLDVGVCPLRPGAWANCKSDIKALEYCLAGAAPVVSLTEPYRAWTDGLALTAATPKEFLKQIRWLVSNRDAAPELAATGRTYALAERTIGRSIDCWREAVSGPRHRRYQKGNQER